jgi:hypothetical protein
MRSVPSAASIASTRASAHNHRLADVRTDLMREQSEALGDVGMIARAWALAPERRPSGLRISGATA